MADSVKKPDTTEPAAVTPVKTVKTWRDVPVWGWALGAFVVFFAVVGMVAACFSVFNHADSRFVTTSRVGMMQRGLNDDRDQFSTGNGARSGFGGRMMGSMDTNSNTRLSGVVTAVENDTITVAGNGTTTKVTVSDSTTYSGSSKPAAVNDTIVVTGAMASDDSFTAATVYLSRQ